MRKKSRSKLAKQEVRAVPKVGQGGLGLRVGVAPAGVVGPRRTGGVVHDEAVAGGVGHGDGVCPSEPAALTNTNNVARIRFFTVTPSILMIFKGII